jgi:hypothetical protein
MNEAGDKLVTNGGETPNGPTQKRQIPSNRVIARLVRDNARLVRDNARLVRDNAGLVRDNARLVRDNARLVRDITGMVRNNAGLVRNNAGLVRNNAGLVRNNALLVWHRHCLSSGMRNAALREAFLASGALAVFFRICPIRGCLGGFTAKAQRSRRGAKKR